MVAEQEIVMEAERNQKIEIEKLEEDLDDKQDKNLNDVDNDDEENQLEWPRW